MIKLAPRAALLALALTLAAAAPAAAQNSPIEGVWTFSGGEIAVDKQGDGWIGTVVRPTQLADCVHQNGEQIWIDIRLQPDGSYWGKHQYFSSSCEFIDRGNTAYRVLNRAGQTFLRVCFSRPDTPELQPKIAEDGTESDTNDGCRDSEFVAPLPTTPPKIDAIASGLPPAKKGCSSRRRFPIRLKEPPGDALKSATITLGRKKLRVVESGGRLRSVVDLRGLPRGRYTLKIVARTHRGRTLTGTRRYRTCGKVRRIGNVGPI